MAAERNPPEERSLLSGPLHWITECTLQAPQTTLFICAALAVLCVGIAVNGLEFKTSRLDLLSRKSEYNRRWLRYQAEFGEQDDAVLVVQGESPEVVGPAIDDLEAALHERKECFDSILARRDLSKLKPKALHFLPLDRVQNLEQQAAVAERTIDHGAACADPVTALRQWNDTWEGRPQMQSYASQQAAEDYATLAGGLLPAFANGATTQTAPTASTTGLTAEFSQLDPQYLYAAKGRIGFILLRMVQAKQSFVRNDAPVRELHKVIAEVAPRHPQVWIGLTGMPVVEHDEMEASGTDTFYSSFFSLAGVALLFVAGYGGLRHAGLACLSLLFGIAWAFGYVTLCVGHLNILSASFGAILIGLGIDFGIHRVAGYLQLRKKGYDCREALMTTARTIGPGIVIGAITSAASFFMAGLTEFVGIAELGIIAGGGILCCLAAAIVVLPPLILLIDEAWPTNEVAGILPLGKWMLPFHSPPQFMTAICLLVVVGLSAGLYELRYDHNLLNMQPRHLESAAIERELFARLDDSIWYTISVCDGRDELLDRKQKLEKLPTVAKVEEIVSLTPQPDAQRTRLIAKVHDSLANIAAATPLRTIDVPQLQGELARAERIVREQNWDRTPAGQAVLGLQQTLAHLPAEQIEPRLDTYRLQLRNTLKDQLAPLRDVCDPIAPTLDDLPHELTDRFVGKNQRHLLKVYARGDIWEMDELRQFVADCESVDPLITGHPVQTYYVCHHLQQSYLMAGVMSLVVVFSLVYLDFQSIRDTLLAMVPLALGSMAMFGIIGWLGIPLNPANMIVLPIILGIGVDDGVHLMHEFRSQRGRYRLTDSTATAVLLTSTTTMVSFGAMIFARHQGLQTLGQVLTLGSACCLVTSLVFFPAMLAWLTSHRTEESEADDHPDEAATSSLSLGDTERESSFAETVEAPAPKKFFTNWQNEEATKFELPAWDEEKVA